MKPLIQIVDDNDQLIGYKPRADVDYQNDIYRSSCIWIESTKGEVLLAQRKWDKDKDPGKWGTAAAGTVDKGETYETNARKELEEEIGVKGIELKEVVKFKETLPRRHFIQVYRGVVDWPLQKFKIQEAEVEQIAWVSKQELQADYTDNPNKYVPSMPQLIKLFIEQV